MNPEELDIVFKEAVDKVNNHMEPFPADLLLRLYAYYKKASKNQDDPNSKKPLINAFKANALFQVREMSTVEAKQAYIDAVNTYFLYRK
ncbi:MAG: acyl-CoA-binding protein [Flavobacteriaceae bacterium]